MEIQKILDRNDPKELRALFAFDSKNTNEQVIFKFNIWSRFFFVKYFTSPDCESHKEMDLNNLKTYRGDITQYINIAYRGFSKTARTKLFIAYCIANDLDHTKKFIRCISADLDNAKQSVTDIYNMFVQPRVSALYPEIFEKTESKREETMSGFTTATGIKVLAKQIGVDQRGKIMEEAKSDFDWYDDIETKTTIRSALITHKIGENMEEARTGLAINGSSIYTCNYFSEAGNVHRLVIKESDKKVVQITPIMDVNGNPTWSRYTKEDIERMKREDEDFEGERMCKPNASKDVYFDRVVLDKMPVREPILIIGGFKMFRKYNPSHRYAGGHDVAGGVGLDSSTSVFIDFDCYPAQVVGVFDDNTILPEAFGDEIYSQANRFGGCLIAPENNKYDQVILKARMLGAKLYTPVGTVIKIHTHAPTTFGWNTNSLTKSAMFSSLREATENGLIELNYKPLIDEAKAYTRNDIIDNPPDIRLTTRHFDLLTACFVKGTLILTEKGQKPIETLMVGDKVMTREGYKRIIKMQSRLKPVITKIGLTGTANHPVITCNNGIKELQSISKGDNLYIWNQQSKTIESMSYIKALNTLDTQSQKIEHTEFTLWEGLNGKNQRFISTGKYGLIITERFQKVIQCIIKTEIPLITLSKIFVSYLTVNICDFICKTKKKENQLKPSSILKRIEKSRKKVYWNILQIKDLVSLFVNGVVRILSPLPTMQSSVVGLAYSDSMERLRKIQNQNDFVSYASNDFKQVSLIRRDVQLNVALNEGEKNIQRVYNIEVEDTPEYFANNILVHNCAIAWQMRSHTRPAQRLMDVEEFMKGEKNEAI